VRIILFFSLVTVFTSSVYSLTNDTLSSYDKTYYTELKDKLSIHVYGILKLNSLEFKNSTSDTVIRYKPNEKFNMGLGFNYKWAGVSAAFNLKFINNDDDIYGKSTSFDLQSDVFSRRYLSTINFQAYKGFYFDNVNRYDTTWSIRDSVPLRPDFITLNIGFNSIYAVNFRKFSLKAPYVHTEWQKRSAGSWLIGIHLSAYSLFSDTLVLPSMLRSSFPVYNRAKSISTSSMGASGGYSYTLVLYEEFYLNALLMVGFSLQAFKTLDLGGKLILKDIQPATKSTFRLSLGYNNDKCYYGISVIAESFPVKNSFQSSFIYNYGRLRLFYGRRFNLNL